MRVKKNDTVIVLTGGDKGRRGKVLEVTDNGQRLVVEGIKQVKRHVKAGRDPKAPQGGIIEVSSPIQISNVRVICSKCDKPTRLRVRRLESGKKVRFCSICKESVDKS